LTSSNHGPERAILDLTSMLDNYLHVQHELLESIRRINAPRVSHGSASSSYGVVAVRTPVSTHTLPQKRPSAPMIYSDQPRATEALRRDYDFFADLDERLAMARRVAKT
jgi:hypothetical protein